MTEEWAKQFPDIHFSSMHPGWADTPAVRTSMPDFHRRLKDKLRTSEEGADTVVWLAIADAALATKSGQYFLVSQIRKVNMPTAPDAPGVMPHPAALLESDTL